MARKLGIVTIITLILVSLSCQPATKGPLLPPRPIDSKYVENPITSDMGEIDIVNKLSMARQEYHLILEGLVNYYTRTGNNEKRSNAEQELMALSTMPQFDYINPLDVMDRFSPDTQIMNADLLYDDAMLDKQQAEKYSLLLVDKNLYRAALAKFKQLIINYNHSDKIDDAAYQIGEIDEYFKNYSEALRYYKACYTWNSETQWPARFHAARILDKYMHNYAEALPIYREAVEKEGMNPEYREWKRNAEERISAIEKTMQ